MDQHTLLCAYNALILPIGITHSDRLQRLQNRAARVITGRKNEHGQSELALNELNWVTLEQRRT